MRPCTLLRDRRAKGVFANVEGPWIHPDAMDAERLVDIAHACPSGAIRYQRKDGRPDEAPPPVNLIAVREAGPYAVRGDIHLDGQNGRSRATLCRCGASKNKPFCDGSHHDAGFSATGEPPTGKADMLAVATAARDRSRDRWSASGSRQSRDHERHGSRRRPCYGCPPMPVRGQRQ